MATCKFCGENIIGLNLFKHQWSSHHDEMEQLRQKGQATRFRNLAAKAAKEAGIASDDGVVVDNTVTAEGNGSPSGQQPDNNGNNSKPQPQAQKKSTPVVTPTGAKLTNNISEAVSLSITPKAFTMNSSLLWAAMEAVKREWHWPANMTPEQFLDTFLYESLKQRGLLISSYTVLWPQTPGTPEVIDNNGHSGHDGNGNGNAEAVSDEYGQKEPNPVMASF